MATNIMGLFGATPEEIRARRMQQQQQEVANMANLTDPRAFMAYVGSGLGSQLAGAARDVGGMFGLRSQEEEQAMQEQEVLREAQQSGLSGSALYKRLADISADPRRAIVLRQQAAEMEAAEAKAAQDAQDAALQRRKTLAEVKELEGKSAAASAAQQRKLTTVTSLVPNINPKLAAGLASPEGEKAYTEFLSSQVKTKAPDTTIGKLLKERDALPEGHPDRKFYNDKLLKETNTNNEASALGKLAEALVQATGSKAGQEIGKSVTQLPKQEEAANYVEQAIKLLDKGIYSGFYGGTGELAAKATLGAVGNAERVANTELFRNLVGQTIIPRLEEFGGNDSVEELLFLKRVQGGDTSMTKEALVATLKNVEKMIERGIRLKRAQEKAISEGKPPPMALPDEPKKRSTKKRYNPATGKVEVVEE